MCQCQHERTDPPKPQDCCSEDLCRRTCQKGAAEDRRSRKKWVSIPSSSDMTTEVLSRRKTLQLPLLSLCPAPCQLCQLCQLCRGGFPSPSITAGSTASAGAEGRPITACSMERCRRPSCWCCSRTCNSLKPLSELSPGIPQCRGSRGENQK